MDEKQMMVAAQDSPLIMDAMGVEQAKKQFANLQQFVKSQMRVDVDFGIIKGLKKNSLYKPGAEKLLFFHGLGCKLEPVTPDTIADWKNGFFNYCYRATVYNPRTGAVIATADGSCNSKEEKYRYTWVYENEIPKGVRKEDLVCKERESKKGGTYKMFRLENDDPFSLVNTIQKMAEKRAMIAATLMACRASDIFTQDMEDKEEGGSSASEGGAQKAAGASASGSGTISEPQRKRLWAIMKECGVEEETLAQHLKEKYAYTVGDDDQPHSSKIKWGNDYNAIVNWLEGQRKK